MTKYMRAFMPFRSPLPLVLFTGLIIVCSTLFSCRKTGNQTDRSDTPISFYNASEYLQGQVVNSSTPSYILIDTPDTTQRPDGSALSLAGFVSDQTIYQFPNLEYYAKSQVQSWISYMRIFSGLHTVILTDTGGHHPLAYTRITADHNQPMSIYYADSLGIFRSWALTDTATITDTAVGIRVLDLSPDAGPVFFTINGQYVSGSGFPDSLQYGKITPFINWPNPVADTLHVRFYQTNDSTDVIASGMIIAGPGHAYNLLFRGYLNSCSVTDPYSKRQLQFNPDLKAVVTQTK